MYLFCSECLVQFVVTLVVLYIFVCSAYLLGFTAHAAKSVLFQQRLVFSMLIIFYVEKSMENNGNVPLEHSLLKNPLVSLILSSKVVRN